MNIDPTKIQVYRPPWMNGFKRITLERIAKRCGRKEIIDADALDTIPDDVLPLICCTGEIAGQLRRWRKAGRPFLYWDRGYLRRLGGLWPPTDGTSGYYRVNYNCFQMPEITRAKEDRWRALRIDPLPWHKGRSIVVATTDSSYWDVHGIKDWLDSTLVTLRELTDRPITVRKKGSHIPLAVELQSAHCLVTHGSNAAVESIILGCPVIVDKSSAAALVGRTELKDVEDMVYPDREPWLHSLAYSQFMEVEFEGGAVWDMI